MKEYKYKINGTHYTVAVGEIENNIAHVEVNGTSYVVELDEKKPVKVAQAPRTAAGEKVIKAPAPSKGGAVVKAPLPGTVLSINVKVGDTVKAADTVVVLEAMKMENAIHAGKDGRVASIDVAQGDAVPEGGVLITLE